MQLRDIGNAARKFPGRKRVRLRTVDEDASLIPFQKPQYAAEQRRLPRAVRPEHGKKLPFPCVKAHVPEHGARPICKIQPFHFNAHSVFSRLRIR